MRAEVEKLIKHHNRWLESQGRIRESATRPRRREKERCGAYARSTGKPCQAPAMKNGRCKLHGGLSTGPKTAEGRARALSNLKSFGK